MADSSAIKAGRAFVELFADDTELAKGLRRAEGKLKSYGKIVGDAGMSLFKTGAAGVTALVGMAVTTAKSGAEMERLSKVTGISVEELSGLKYAASQTETEFETLTKGVTLMHKALGKNSPQTQKTLAELGLSTDQLLQLSPAQRFEQIADAIAKVPDPGMRAAAAMQMFGRAGAQLLPMIERTGAGIRQLREEAAKLGFVMSSDTAAKAAEFDRAMKTVWAVIQATSKAVGTALMPVLLPLLRQVTEWIVKTTKWIKENQGLVVSLLKVAAGIAATGIALVVLSKVFTVGALAIHGVRLAFMATHAVMTFGLGVITTSIAAWKAMAATAASIKLLWGAASGIGEFTGALAASYPLALGLAAALAGAAIGAWIARKEIAQAWETVKADTMEAMGGISDAIAAGEIGLAAKIVWALIKLEWYRGTQVLMDVWNGMSFFVTKTAYSVWDTIVAGWQYAQHGVIVGINAVVGFFQTAWARIKEAALLTWITVAAEAQKMWIRLKGLFSSKIDVKAEITKVDAQTAKAKADVKKEAQSSVADAEQANAFEKARFDKEQADRNATFNQRIQDLEAQYDASVDASQAKVNAARDELARLRKEAADAKAKMNAKVGSGQDSSKTIPTMPQVGAMASVGGFSSSAALRFGQASPLDSLLKTNQRMSGSLDRIERNTARTADGVEDIGEGEFD